MKGLFASDEMRFLRSFLADPLRVASPIPSGRRLARTIAAQIDPRPGGIVLELGPGTGPVTQAILESGVAPCDLVAIESDAEFAAQLREDFAGVRIIEGDAFEFPVLLRAAGLDAPLRTIVSGVPVLSARSRCGADCSRTRSPRCVPAVPSCSSPTAPIRRCRRSTMSRSAAPRSCGTTSRRCMCGSIARPRRLNCLSWRKSSIAGGFDAQAHDRPHSPARAFFLPRHARVGEIIHRLRRKSSMRELWRFCAGRFASKFFLELRSVNCQVSPARDRAGSRRRLGVL